MSDVYPREYRGIAIDYYGDERNNCGSESNIEVHHIDCNRNSNNLCNLVPLCHDCHMKVHHDRIKCEGYLKQLARQVPVKVSNRLYREAMDVADEYECSMKEAVARMCDEGGYDV